MNHEQLVVYIVFDIFKSTAIAKTGELCNIAEILSNSFMAISIDTLTKVNILRKENERSSEPKQAMSINTENSGLIYLVPIYQNIS